MLYKQLIATLNTSKALLVTGAVPYTWLSTEECNGRCWKCKRGHFVGTKTRHSRNTKDWRLPCYEANNFGTNKFKTGMLLWWLNLYHAGALHWFICFIRFAMCHFDWMLSVTILMEGTCMSWAMTACEKLHSERGYRIDLKTFEGTLEGNTHCSKRSHDHIRSHPFASILCTLLESWCFGLWHHSSSITLMWRFLTWREKYLLGALHAPYKPVNLCMRHQYIIYLLPGRCFMRVAAQDMLLWAHVILHAVLGKLFIVINRVPKMTLAQWKLSWFTIPSPPTFQKKTALGVTCCHAPKATSWSVKFNCPLHELKWATPVVEVFLE